MEPVTLITGGSTGIGAATARTLLKQGHHVAVTGRDAGKLATFAASAGAGERLLTITGDAAEAEDVAAAVRRVVETWGRLDNVIANAGFSLPGNLEGHAPEDMRAMVLTNVLGPALLVREALPQLRASQGRIVFIGSVAGVRNTPGNLYSVTKWAVHALAENTRLLVAKDRVGVTVVAPGVVDTAFWAERGGTPDEAMTPEQIAATIAFALNQPAGVDINQITMRPTGQLG
ncbi:SDR family oxidoreductase [Streptomyces sp. NPDC048387]|uniref:SDR family oxidoreductase n=1 Tax=Streptomyces sp. NPDC048387 TaxID=3365542 RepID=UPI00371FA15F